MEGYKAFVELKKETTALQDTLSLLFWDEQVNLPQGAASARGEQIAVLSALVHKKRLLRNL